MATTKNTVTAKDKTTAAEVPTIGRVLVMAGVPHDKNNGADEAPAVVVRVFQGSHVNVRVLCDGPEVLWFTSVPVFAGPDELEEAREDFLAGMPEGAQFC